MSPPRLASLCGLLALVGAACDRAAEDTTGAVGDLGDWEIDCNNLVVDGGFCLNPDYPELIMAAGFMSDDRGLTWWQPPVFPGDASLLTPEGGAACSERRGPLGLVVVDAGDDRLYSVTEALLLRSDDGGATWRQLTLPMQTGQGLRYSLSASAANLLFTMVGKLFVSHDAGESFAERPGPLEVDTYLGAVLTPGGLWLVDVGDRGLFASRDEGASWTPLGAGLTGRPYVGPDGDVWIVGDAASRGFWHSTDGVAWSRRDPTSGPFRITGDGYTVREVLPLPGSSIAFRGEQQGSPTGRPAMVCVMGPAQSTSSGPAPLPAPPAMGALGPGELVHWRPVTQGAPVLGALTVATDGTPYVALATHTVSIGQELLFEAHWADFVRPTCGGSESGLDHLVVDLDFDPLTGSLQVLGRPPTYYPQDWAELPGACLADAPEGPWVASLDPESGALLSLKDVGPVSCARPQAGSQVLAKCGNDACDVTDAMFCPDDCGVVVLCGNGACDDWEQLHCAGDCISGTIGGPSWGGTCGNLSCDDEVFEPGFCPGDCPPWPGGCSDGLEALFVDPLALVPPSGVFTAWGYYDLPVDNFVNPQIHPPRPLGELSTHLVTRGHLGGDFFVLRDGWIRRYEPPGPDPCYVPAPAESAHCYPAPEGSVSALGISERSGHLYALLETPGQLVRRPIDADSAPWELVVEALVRPVDLAVLDTAGDTRLFILDGDVWQAIPPESAGDGPLPLVRSY